MHSSERDSIRDLIASEAEARKAVERLTEEKAQLTDRLNEARSQAEIARAAAYAVARQDNTDAFDVVRAVEQALLPLLNWDKCHGK